MNYLAHLHLSFPEPALMLGNFIADSVTNKQVLAESKAIAAGVKMHRFIDHYADNHLAVRRSYKRLYPTQGKYAMVLTDIYYDHILASHWKSFSDEDFEVFCHRVYDIFDRNVQLLSPELQPMIRSFVERRWLGQYADLDGTAGAIRRLAARVRFPHNFEYAISDFVTHRDGLTEDFMSFYPDILAETGHFIPRS